MAIPQSRLGGFAFIGGEHMTQPTHFGMPTLIELKTPEACAELCSELGLAFVELSMDLPEYQEEKLDVAELRRIALKHGIYYTIHIEGFLDPCVFNDRVAAAYTETVLQVIEKAQQLNVPVLNMHLNKGDYFSLPDRKVFLYDEYKSEYLHKLAAFRDACAAAVGDTGITICIENCGHYKQCGFIVEGLDALLKNSVFALTFDIGHNAGADFTDEPVIMEHADRLRHMHVHDAVSDEKRNHIALGEGELDLMKYLAMAEEHKCRAVLEVKTVEGLRRSVTWLRERGHGKRP
jgi:sugar phosphate isomerase/epimerase